MTEQFNTRVGYVVSPYVPFVRARVARLIDQFANADCLFFDQLGSRRWLYYFNHASRLYLPTRTAGSALQHATRAAADDPGWLGPVWPPVSQASTAASP